MFGLTTDRNAWVYLSDGGHFENLGVYELVRRRCRLHRVVRRRAGRRCHVRGPRQRHRASAAPTSAWTSRWRCSRSGPARPPLSQWHCAVGTIRYDRPTRPKAIPARCSTSRATLTGDEPADVLRYAALHAEFPHESTGDQFFDESQFESYRALGYHVACDGPAGRCGSGRVPGDGESRRAVHALQAALDTSAPAAAGSISRVLGGARTRSGTRSGRRRSWRFSTRRFSRDAEPAARRRPLHRARPADRGAARARGGRRELLAAAERGGAPEGVLRLHADPAADGGRVPGAAPRSVPRPHRQPRLDEPVPALGLVGHALRDVGDDRIHVRSALPALLPVATRPLPGRPSVAERDEGIALPDPVEWRRGATPKAECRRAGWRKGAEADDRPNGRRRLDSISGRRSSSRSTMRATRHETEKLFPII